MISLPVRKALLQNCIDSEPCCYAKYVTILMTHFHPPMAHKMPSFTTCYGLLLCDSIIYKTVLLLIVRIISVRKNFGCELQEFELTSQYDTQYLCREFLPSKAVKSLSVVLIIISKKSAFTQIFCQSNSVSSHFVNSHFVNSHYVNSHLS